MALAGTWKGNVVASSDGRKADLISPHRRTCARPGGHQAGMEEEAGMEEQQQQQLGAAAAVRAAVRSSS